MLEGGVDPAEYEAQLAEVSSRLKKLEAEFAAAKTEHEDFNYLARIFGPDEIQLREIQAAVPEVSTLVVALQEGCFDNKFEVRFLT